MQTIELDQEFFDSVKNDKREDVVNGIVNNVMSGQYEYACVGMNWNLQDFVNDALGEQEVSELMCEAVASKLDDDMRYALEQIDYTARETLRCLVVSFCNQEEIGIA